MKRRNQRPYAPAKVDPNVLLTQPPTRELGRVIQTGSSRGERALLGDSYLTHWQLEEPLNSGQNAISRWIGLWTHAETGLSKLHYAQTENNT
jgi:hypothetical protein